MPDEDENFGGSLVLDFRKWWRNVKMIYIFSTLKWKPLYSRLYLQKAGNFLFH